MFLTAIFNFLGSVRGYAFENRFSFLRQMADFQIDVGMEEQFLFLRAYNSYLPVVESRISDRASR